MSEETERRAREFRDWKIDLEVRALIHVEAEREKHRNDPPPEKCPTCVSKFHEIHGCVYEPGNQNGRPCTDPWHSRA